MTDRTRIAAIATLTVTAVVLSVACQAVRADDDAPKQPPRIVFPHVEPQPKPAPLPKPDPDAIPRVALGELYVVTSTVPFRAAVSPEDFAHTSEAKGPVQINAVFHGGSGKREWKTFTGYVFVVDPQVKDVRLEILLSFNGEERPGEFVRQLIDIGVGPRPPPDPDVEPAPKPEPKPQPAAFMRVLLLQENQGKYTKDQINALDSTILVGWLKENCVKVGGRAEWRRWDRSSVESTGLKGESLEWQNLWSDVLGKEAQTGKKILLPALIVETDKGVQVHQIQSTAAALATLKAIKGN